MSDIRNKSLKLYYSGKSKESICKKFSTKLNQLDYWIDSDTRRKALDLYLLGEKKTRICKKLSIYMSELDGWIKDMYGKKTKKEADKEPTMKPGRSEWVSSICSDWNDVKSKDAILKDIKAEIEHIGQTLEVQKSNKKDVVI